MNLDAWMLVGSLLLAGVGVAFLVQAARRVVSGPTLPPQLAAARRHSTLSGVCAEAVMWTTIVGLWVMAFIVESDINGSRVLAVVPMLSACAALVVLLIGERMWPMPEGPVRSAALERRHVSQLINRYWVALATSAALALVALLLWAGFSADASGRRLDAAGVPAWARPAFPGWFYGLPQVAGLIVLTALTGLILLASVTRPAVVTADLQTDDHLRTASGVRALRIATVAVFMCLSGNSYVAANATSPESSAVSTALLVVFVVSGAAVVGVLATPFVSIGRRTPQGGRSALPVVNP